MKEDNWTIEGEILQDDNNTGNWNQSTLNMELFKDYFFSELSLVCNNRFQIFFEN